LNLAPIIARRDLLALNPKGPHSGPEYSQRVSYGLGDFLQNRGESLPAEEAGSELGILLCENCGKLLKLQDVPCACGNCEYFIVLDDCSLLLCMDAYQDTEGWPSEHLALSA